jgi:putative transposase
VPRRPREEVEGGIYHVYARGNNRQRIFVDDEDRRLYLALLHGVAERYEWRCLAYCLMDNHVHLLIETPKPNLAQGMQRLQSAYAQLFNERHDRVGHLFQGRYGAVRLETDEQLWSTLAYIAANPVEAGMVERADEWPWSSHHQVLAQKSFGLIDLDRLIALLSGSARQPIATYAALVEGSDPLQGVT